MTVVSPISSNPVCAPLLPSLVCFRFRFLFWYVLSWNRCPRACPLFSHYLASLPPSEHPHSKTHCLGMCSAPCHRAHTSLGTNTASISFILSPLYLGRQFYHRSR